jgi:hypothetical protein
MTLKAKFRLKALKSTYFHHRRKISDRLIIDFWTLPLPSQGIQCRMRTYGRNEVTWCRWINTKGSMLMYCVMRRIDMEDGTVLFSWFWKTKLIDLMNESIRFIEEKAICLSTAVGIFLLHRSFFKLHTYLLKFLVMETDSVMTCNTNFCLIFHFYLRYGDMDQF